MDDGMIVAGDSQESPSNTIRLSDHESIIEEGRIELMFQIDLKSRKAIYEQVIDHFKELIMAGVLKPEDKVPSVRDMAKTLTINPNTIQKAYRELESQGYIYTVSGLGSFISAPPKAAVDIQRINELKESLRRCLSELIYLNCSRTEICAILEELKLYQGEETRQ